MNDVLAVVADIYNPSLLIWSLSVVIHRWRRGKKSYAFEFAAITCFVYGLMWLDIALGIWPSHRLDFSTHTATAVGMTLFLSWEARMQRFISLFIILLVYAQLMVYLAYHSWVDILSTAGLVTVGVMSILLIFSLYRRRKYFRSVDLS